MFKYFEKKEIIISMRFEKKKSSIIFILLLTMSLVFIYYSLPDVAPIIKAEKNLIGKFTLVSFFCLLFMFCFFGLYYFLLYIFYFFKIRGKSYIIKSSFEIPPPVAICYTTKNDFQEEAVVSCINQNYPDFHIFILDDSTDEEYKIKIDKFAEGKNEITVIRRPVARGFKAGNLNYALQNIPSRYEYIAILDSDEIIPEHFISDFIAHFPANPNLAFVQAVHRSYENQKTLFAKDLSLINDIHWKYLVPVKNKYGFVMFHGHGAIFKRKFLNEVGGFPEIVSEDLAVSVLLREKGYYGYTNTKIVCYEETPKTYLRYRKRHEKWVRGTAEFVKKFIKVVLFGKKIPWYEKFDIIMGNLCLFTPVFLFLFLLICGFALPFFVSTYSEINLSLIFFHFKMPFAATEKSFLKIWTWKFVLPVLTSILIHYIPAINEYKNNPKKLIRHLKNTYVVSTGMTIFTFIGFFGGLLSKETYFAATGDEKDTTQTNVNWIKGYISDRPVSFYMELLFGIILFISFLLTFNIWLLPPSTSFMLSYLIYKKTWDSKLVQSLLFIPFICMVFIILFVIFITTLNSISNL